MPIIASGRVASGTGNINFVSGPSAGSGGSSSTPDAAVATTTSGTGATGPTGPAGPAGAAGASSHSQLATVGLTLPATAAATASAILLSTSLNLLSIQVLAVTTGPTQNYVLALYDGNPTGNVLLYQATGITTTTYSDNSPFYLAAPMSGAIWAQITNIDADATTATITLRYLVVT